MCVCSRARQGYLVCCYCVANEVECVCECVCARHRAISRADARRDHSGSYSTADTQNLKKNCTWKVNFDTAPTVHSLTPLPHLSDFLHLCSEQTNDSEAATLIIMILAYY
jgi:hypothetical protein